MRRQIFLRVLAASATIGVLAIAPAGDAQVGLERKVVLQQDLKMPGYETVVMEVSLAVGRREGRHTHPGTLIGYLLQGELTLEVEGQPTLLLVDQLAAADSTRLGRPAGRLTTDELAEADAALRIVLGLR